MSLDITYKSGLVPTGGDQQTQALARFLRVELSRITETVYLLNEQLKLIEARLEALENP